MADTYFFLKLDGIDGECQDKDHNGEIDVLSFVDGISNAGSYDAGTGGNTGQAYYSDLTFSKYMDKSSSTLRQYCGLGTSIDKATLSCNKQAGDKKVEYYKVTMHNVVITSVNSSGSGGGSDPISETLTL